VWLALKSQAHDYADPPHHFLDHVYKKCKTRSTVQWCARVIVHMVSLFILHYTHSTLTNTIYMVLVNKLLKII